MTDISVLEGRATEKNSLLLETQRMEQSITINHQRDEMRRLYRVVSSMITVFIAEPLRYDSAGIELNNTKIIALYKLLMKKILIQIEAMNREKALLPPTVLAAAFPIVPRGGVPEGIPTIKEYERLKELIDQLESVVKAPPAERGVLALQQLRVVEEQARLIGDLMSSVDDVASKQLDLFRRELV